MAIEQKKTDEKKEEVRAPANTKSQADVDPLQVEVNNCGNFRDSLEALITGIANQIIAVKDNADQVSVIAARLKERAKTWVDAVTNNTNYAPAAELESEKGKAEREKTEKK